MYKMVAEITNETCGKCGIETVKHYNEKENITEFRQNISEIQSKIHYKGRKTKIQSIF